MEKPLAERLRPKELHKVVGQEHILGKGKILSNLVEKGEVPNMLFYGPPGTGKTTVAQIIASKTSKKLHCINGTNASVADVRSALGDVNTLFGYKGVLIYLDEIQNFNKKQQQSLLEYVEKGRVSLIASTTENPYHYIYPALLSRSIVFEFKNISIEAMKKGISEALEFLKEDGWNIICDDESLETISHYASGDMRKALNIVDMLLKAYGNEKNLEVKKHMIEDSLGKAPVKYDMKGDFHYDILSALQKSIRGSDENAALHYLARILRAGDLISACRRILVTASEDIGMAYPNAITIVKACVDSAFQLGLPEARIPLAQAVVLLSKLPKSNSAYAALDSAWSELEQVGDLPVPLHLRDAHYAGAKSLNRGEGYKYPHNYDSAYVKQQYLPTEIKDRIYYKRSDNKFEKGLEDYWDKVKKK